MLVPNLRHVMTTASAIATLEDLAPGRFVYGLGTGESARTVLNKKRLSLATTRRYFEQLRGLLRGEVVEIDGEQCQMIHWPGLAPPRPIDGAAAVVGVRPEDARDRAGDRRRRDDACRTSPSGLDWNVRMVNGTILDPGEDLTTPRVQAAVGPWLVLPYHVAAQWRPDRARAPCRAVARVARRVRARCARRRSTISPCTRATPPT